MQLLIDHGGFRAYQYRFWPDVEGPCPTCPMTVEEVCGTLVLSLPVLWRLEARVTNSPCYEDLALEPVKSDVTHTN